MKLKVIKSLARGPFLMHTKPHGKEKLVIEGALGCIFEVEDQYGYDLLNQEQLMGCLEVVNDREPVSAVKANVGSAPYNKMVKEADVK